MAPEVLLHVLWPLLLRTSSWEEWTEEIRFVATMPQKSSPENFNKYIVNFLVGVAISNAYIFYRLATQKGATSLKKFHELVAIQLIGDYCSRKKPGRISYLVKPLPITHFPQKRHDSPGTKRGHYVVCQEKKRRRYTPWFCSSCGVWLCHQGSSTDCFLLFHTKNSIKHNTRVQ